MLNEVTQMIYRLIKLEREEWMYLADLNFKKKYEKSDKSFSYPEGYWELDRLN